MKLVGAIIVCLALAAPVLAQRDQFGIRYLGGSLETRTSKESWDNRLTIRADVIRLELKDGQKLEIDPRSITSISYGREATRHVARWVTLGILVSPLFALGLYSENVQHYVSIEYLSAEQKSSGVLIQAHKDNYRNVLALLRGATGKEIETEKKNQKPVRPK